MILCVFSTLLSSCFREEAVPGLLDGTMWVRFSLGPVFDENNNFLYSSMESDTLIFGKNTYTYAYGRKKTEGKNASYVDSINDRMNGTYIVKYPEIIMNEENWQRIGTLSINYLTVDWNKNNRPMYFVKRQTN
jgi:hypothetical protein